MNPGYLCLILMCMTMILAASGWNAVLIPSLKDRTLLAFIVSWLLLGRVQLTWPGSPHLEIGLVLVLLLFIAFHHIAVRPSRLFGLHLLSIGLFLASLYYLCKHMAMTDPLFFPYHSPVAAAIGLGLVAALLCRDARDQVMVLTLGVAAGSGLYAFVHLKTGYAVWGGKSFQDEWWAAAAAARSASICWESTWSLSTGIWRKWRKDDGSANQERRE